MRLILALLLTLATFTFAAGQEFRAEKQQFDELTKSLVAIEKTIDENVSRDDQLLQLRQKLDQISSDLIKFGVSFRPALTLLNDRIAQIGDPPAEGAPPEPELVTEERAKLAAEKAMINTLRGEAEKLSIRVSTNIDRISDLRRDLFTNTLFRQTEAKGVFSSESWNALTNQVSVAWRTIRSRIHFMWNFRPDTLFSALGLALLLAMTVQVTARRFFSGVYSREPVDAQFSYISRLSIAFWATVVPSLSWALTLGAIFIVFGYFVVFAGQSEEIFEAALISLTAVYFIWRLAVAVFAPNRPEKRLIPMTDRASSSMVWLTLAMAVTHIVDFFLSRLDDITISPLSLTVAKSMASSLIISGLLILIALVRPFDGSATNDGRAWPRWIRIPLILLAGFVIVAAFTGYIGLARFAAAQIVVTGAILATMFIGMQSGQVLAVEGGLKQTTAGGAFAHRFQLSDAMMDQIGLIASFLVYVLVVFTGVPLIALQWGFQSGDISSILYRAMTDIRIGSMSISLIGILFGMLLFAVGFLVTRRFQHWLDASVMKRSRVDSGVRNSIRTVIGYAGVALAALIGVSAAGFDLSNLAIIAGALSLGIGFGLQNIFSNFVSGLILLVERPFKVGDWVEAGNYTGFVRKISVRATEIETFQKQTIILPNSEFINNAVGNWTLRNHLGRIDIPVGVAYGTNPRKVHDLLMEIAKADPSVAVKPEPFVLFKGFGDSSLDFEMRIHIADILESLVVQNRIRLAILDVFEENGIEIPFPQTDMNIKVREAEAMAGELLRQAKEVKDAAVKSTTSKKNEQPKVKPAPTDAKPAKRSRRKTLRPDPDE